MGGLHPGIIEEGFETSDRELDSSTLVLLTSTSIILLAVVQCCFPHLSCAISVIIVMSKPRKIADLVLQKVL